MEQETEDCLHVAAFGAARVRSNRNNFNAVPPAIAMCGEMRSTLQQQRVR